MKFDRPKITQKRFNTPFGFQKVRAKSDFTEKKESRKTAEKGACLLPFRQLIIYNLTASFGGILFSQGTPT